MNKIGVVTATRAEYGLLRNIIRLIHQDESLELILLVTGTHLESFYGNTISEIEADNIPIAHKVYINAIGNNSLDIVNSMSTAQKKFGEIYEKEQLDMLLVLGDRYELIPICSSAMIFQIPIAHISGGEITEGAIDDVVRHCITKMSYLHFPACETYKNRLIQLGEGPDRIFNYGDLGIENILNTNYMSKEELEEDLQINLEKPYAIVTFHPTTLEKGSETGQLSEILEAIEERDEYQYIFTKSNADLGGKAINIILEGFCQKHDNAFLFSSLGSRRYLSAIKYCTFVLGNSSSGLYEVPALRKPTINVGNRQKGRIAAKSVINCKPDKNDILAAIKQAGREDFLKEIQDMEIPFTGDNTSGKIVEQIKKALNNRCIDLKKHFYDVKFNTN